MFVYRYCFGICFISHHEIFRSESIAAIDKATINMYLPMSNTIGISIDHVLISEKITNPVMRTLPNIIVNAEARYSRMLFIIVILVESCLEA